MKTTMPLAAGRRANRGVALIITLGLLSVLTLLAVAFAIAMRVEHMASRNYANMIRARHMVQTALSKAVDDVNLSCAGKTYPKFSGASQDARGCPSSPGFTRLCDFFPASEPGAAEAIPPALLVEARKVSSYWSNVVVNVAATGPSLMQTNGRISYLIVNCSGLLDANYMGGKPRLNSTNISELDISYVIPSAAAFVSERSAIHKRYESVEEAYRLTVADRTYCSNLYAYSYDPGPDVYLKNTNQIGSPSAVLVQKFNINAITNYAAYRDETSITAYNSDPVFMAKYFQPLKTNLMAALPDMDETKAIDVTWNVIQYLDPDRIPEGGGTSATGNLFPWRHTEAGENTPLINEIHFDAEPGGPANDYRFRVELWYPFIPQNVTASDNFKLQIGIFSNNWQGTTSAPEPPVVMSKAWRKYEFNIADMTFGTPTEFEVYQTPALQPPRNPLQPLSTTNCFWFLARVVKVKGTITNICDEAMGYDKAETQSGAVHRRALKKFEGPVNYQINDPRINGQIRYWDPTVAGSGYPATCKIGRKTFVMTEHTLGPTLAEGALNTPSYFTYFSNSKAQGFPIWHGNGPMKNISEMGHVFRSNMDDEVPDAYINYGYWRNIDLMNRIEGAALIDWLTVRSSNQPRGGRVTINTRQKQTLHSIFHGLKPADTDADGAVDWGTYMGTINPVKADAIRNLVDVIQARTIALGGCKQWRDLFDAGTDKLNPTEPLDDGGPVARAMRRCVRVGAVGSDEVLQFPAGYLVGTNDILQEAICRSVVEMLSFRQNMFTIYLAGQALGRNGRSVMGEQRAVATIVRDSYTGKYFIRSFRWLTE